MTYCPTSLLHATATCVFSKIAGYSSTKLAENDYIVFTSYCQLPIRVDQEGGYGKIGRTYSVGNLTQYLTFTPFHVYGHFAWFQCFVYMFLAALLASESADIHPRCSRINRCGRTTVGQLWGLAISRRILLGQLQRHCQAPRVTSNDNCKTAVNGEVVLPLKHVTRGFIANVEWEDFTLRPSLTTCALASNRTKVRKK